MTEIVFEHDDFDFETLDEELKVDEQCRQLLYQLYVWLQNQDMTQQHASELAYCVDYYLRDYLLDFLRANALRPTIGLVRYFAGNWYISRTLEPQIAVLEQHLTAIAAFYRFLWELTLINAETLGQLENEFLDLDYYQQRIDSFLSLSGEGFEVWNEACQLPKD